MPPQQFPVNVSFKVLVLYDEQDIFKIGFQQSTHILRTTLLNQQATFFMVVY